MGLKMKLSISLLFVVRLSAATIDLTVTRPNDAPWPTNGDNTIQFQVFTQSIINLSMGTSGAWGYCPVIDPTLPWFCSGSINQGASIRNESGTLASVSLEGVWSRGIQTSNGVDPSGYCPFGILTQYYKACITTLQPGTYWLEVWDWSHTQAVDNTKIQQFLWETDGHILGGDIGLVNPGKQVTTAEVGVVVGVEPVPEPVPEPVAVGLVLVGLVFVFIIRKLKA